ncbi:MAG: fructose-6-phosphate aldolase [Myxococcales bacterium]|nr:MAG: fructose-6-phosphate aldolase [Myxococcales bacterium]
MKFFIDTADVAEIKEALAYGLIDGVTTNPSLVAKTGRPFAEVAKEILSLVDGPVSLEVTALDAEGMIRQAKDLAQLGKNVVVKIPMTLPGMKAVRALSLEEIKTNVTLCFSPSQALLAAKAGATYVSPFVGRFDDISETGMELIEKIVAIYRNYGYETQVLVASVRNPLHVVEAALMGADVATIPMGVLRQLARHPLTDIGIEKFMADWEKVPK